MGLVVYGVIAAMALGYTRGAGDTYGETRPIIMLAVVFIV